MNGTTIVSIVAIVGALILAFRGVRSRSGSSRSWWAMAVAWLVIIVVVVFVINAFDLDMS